MKYFAFDIDGVLKKGGEPIESGKLAMDYLDQNGIPYLFMTNTTGDIDVVCKHLNEIIDHKFTSRNVVCASTPLEVLL